MTAEDDNSELSQTITNTNRRRTNENCSLCGSTDRETICETPVVVRCLRCHHGYRPDPEESIVKSYTGFVNMPTYFEARMFARHHYDYIERNIGFENISSILEICSGDGVLLKLIRKKHARIRLVAIEPSEVLCRGLREIKDLTVIKSYIEEYSPDNKFDLVIMSHVLEHLEKPREILKLVHDNYLNAGGHLYVDIPSQDFELRSPAMASMAPATHLFFFSGEHFRNTLSDAGFSPENIRGVKYSTIPKDYTARMEMISCLVNSDGFIGKIKLFREKAMKKISLRVSVPVRVLFNLHPSEITLEETNDNYNNIAIIARK